MPRKRFLVETESIRLPQPPTQPVSSQGFTFFPAAQLPGGTVEQWMMQQWVYQRAFAEAQAVVRPSILERDLLGVWN